MRLFLWKIFPTKGREVEEEEEEEVGGEIETVGVGLDGRDWRFWEVWIPLTNGVL